MHPKNLRLIGSFPSWCRLDVPCQEIRAGFGRKGSVTSISRVRFDSYINSDCAMVAFTRQAQTLDYRHGFAVNFIDDWNGEDLACSGGDEEHLSGRLFSKIIWPAIKVSSKEQFIHEKPRCRIVSMIWSAIIKRVSWHPWAASATKQGKPSKDERLWQRGQTYESFTSELSHSKYLHDEIRLFWQRRGENMGQEPAKQTAAYRVGTQRQWCQRNKRVVWHGKASFWIRGGWTAAHAARVWTSWTEFCRLHHHPDTNP